MKFRNKIKGNEAFQSATATLLLYKHMRTHVNRGFLCTLQHAFANRGHVSSIIAKNKCKAFFWTRLFIICSNGQKKRVIIESYAKYNVSTYGYVAPVFYVPHSVTTRRDPCRWVQWYFFGCFKAEHINFAHRADHAPMMIVVYGSSCPKNEPDNPDNFIRGTVLWQNTQIECLYCRKTPGSFVGAILAPMQVPPIRLYVNLTVILSSVGYKNAGVWLFVGVSVV